MAWRPRGRAAWSSRRSTAHRSVRWSRATTPPRPPPWRRRAADLLEARRGRLVSLLQREGGKTLDDAVAELREAVDFCRYYAAEARRTLASRSMPGPTGEANTLHYRGR